MEVLFLSAVLINSYALCPLTFPTRTNGKGSDPADVNTIT